MSWLRAHGSTVLAAYPAALARLGIVDREKGEEAFDLAVPVMVTGGLRTLNRVADFFMVSVALGAEAVAALELGFQYYFLPLGLSLALSSGTISLVSRFHGARDRERADRAIKQSVWLALVITIPVTAVTWRYATPMIDLLTDDPVTVRLGATYLRIVMLSVTFRFVSLIASRALAGAGDTRTPMYVRTVTITTNVALNALLIFGLGPFPQLGVAGAAWGTAIANTLEAAVFLVVLLSGWFPVRLRVSGPHWDTGMAGEIIRVGLPLGGMRIAQSSARFPFLFVLGVLGTEVIAAYAIARRVLMLARMPGWGYSTAASTLVGQRIGAGDDDDAAAYGWETLRIAVTTQLLIAAGLFLFAVPIASVFGSENVPLTVTFIHVFALSVAGFSASQTFRGSLRGAGDTRWPFYGTLVGNWLVRLPLAALALPGTVAIGAFGLSIAPGLAIGLPAVYAAILGDFYTRCAINGLRFRSGRWKDVAKASQARAAAD